MHTMPLSILRLQLWLCGFSAQARVLADAEEFAEALELAALIPAPQVLPADGWGRASCVSFSHVSAGVLPGELLFSAQPPQYIPTQQLQRYRCADAQNMQICACFKSFLQAKTKKSRSKLACWNSISCLQEDASAAERTELGDMLHTRYAHQLFAASDYDGAFAHFGMCSAASPLVLLRLFPSLAPPVLLEDLGPSTAGWDPESVVFPPSYLHIMLCICLGMSSMHG